MICSTGIDIVYIPRLVKYINDDVFLNRLLTDAEKKYIFTKKLPYKHLAGRFAAKEAVMKAMGTGWDKGVGWRDIEIVNTSFGKPMVHLHLKAKDIVQDKKFFLSIAYVKDIAVAFAVLEGHAKHEGTHEPR
ncbi:MAG: holo-ACP synthase [Deltaproteobacteria bacterium]|nr:holo-ACP synthase [Deltaproteobacteria bacterium]